MKTDYDVVVIGGGSAGENVAGRAADGGLEAALVERELVGGECSYWACMPSKALLRPGEALAEVRRMPGAAAAVTGALDVRAALERRDSLAAEWDDSGQVAWLKRHDVTLIRGQGRLGGERRVVVWTAEREEVTPDRPAGGGGGHRLPRRHPSHRGDRGGALLGQPADDHRR